jgi:hypothetical protein
MDANEHKFVRSLSLQRSDGGAFAAHRQTTLMAGLQTLPGIRGHLRPFAVFFR